MSIFKKRKFQDSDKDGLDDGWERDVGIHDEQNRHRIPSINIGGILPHKNGIIAIHHDNLKHLPHQMKSLKINDVKKPVLKIDIKQPNLKGKPMALKFDDSGISSLLKKMHGKRKAKR